MSLLHEIVSCDRVRRTLELGDTKHCCAKIISYQSVSYHEFQVPEPWSGDLQKAPIMFVSSNPSLGDPNRRDSKRSKYPRAGWREKDVADFFVHRFSGGSEEWVKDGLNVLLEDGSHDVGWVRYWAGVRMRARELLERDVCPGVDYVLSEIVHCKSRREVGVEEAAPECVRRYLRSLIGESGAKVIVCMGKRAERAVRSEFRFGDRPVEGPVWIGQMERHFAFLRHPNARQARSFGTCLARDEVARLRSILGN